MTESGSVYKDSRPPLIEWRESSSGGAGRRSLTARVAGEDPGVRPSLTVTAGRGQ